MHLIATSSHGILFVRSWTARNQNIIIISKYNYHFLLVHSPVFYCISINPSYQPFPATKTLILFFITISNFNRKFPHCYGIFVEKQCNARFYWMIPFITFISHVPTQKWTFHQFKPFQTRLHTSYLIFLRFTKKLY